MTVPARAWSFTASRSGRSSVRRLGAAIDPAAERVDILLTHLHMDHIQGLGFFVPFFRPSGEIHIWDGGA